MNQIQQTPRRSMGFLEEFCTLLNNERHGATSLQMTLQIQAKITFAMFKQAWRILFDTHPMLRATQSLENPNFFEFTANFDRIPLHFIAEANEDAVKQALIASSRGYNLQIGYWSAYLLQMQTGGSTVIFSIQHAIGDGTSIIFIMAQLLHILQALSKGEQVSFEPMPVPLSLDVLLDRSRFVAPQTPTTELSQPLQYQALANYQQTTPDCYIGRLSQKDFHALHQACRQHKTTINAALYAAWLLAYQQIDQVEGNVDLYTVFNLRGYTTNIPSNDTLAFYAHQTLMNCSVTKDSDFWTLAAQAKEKTQQALLHYQLPPAESAYPLTQEVIAEWNRRDKSQQFMAPTVISNMGKMDAAFENLEETFQIQHFKATANLNGFHALIIFAITFRNELNIFFNYSMPMTQTPWVKKIADKMMELLIQNGGGGN